MLNVAVLMGRLTVDPELRTTGNGVSVTSFAIAVDRAYQKQGQERQADFINVVAWRQTAEFVTRYFRKGQMIAIQGSIQTRNYEDRNGNKRTAVEVVADNVSFCGAKAETGASATPAGSNDAPATSAKAQSFTNAGPNDFMSVEIDDDLPF